ncbi:MAG: type II toxin-antitoxin system RelE/ParE family toxin [Rhodospirillales bacterium]|nr:MAG: type II toxin-antitoxin system RelE/ParE family toxin [Rhodospirillales bacterium]
MIYKTTRRADQDIIEIYLHGASTFGVDQAERYVEGMVAAFELLARNPQLARNRTEFDPPVRLHPYQSHMIAYVTRDDGILIIRVLHGRQAWERCLS